MPVLEPTPRVACLCAAWCRLCEGYASVFDEVVQRVRADWPRLQSRWVDIEDEADLVGDLDIETFPTLVVMQGDELRFAGTLTPQPGTLERVLRNALGHAPGATERAQWDPAFHALAKRLADGGG